MFCIDRYFCEFNLDIINMSRLEHRLSLDPGQDQQSMIVWYGSDRLITIVIKPISDFQLMIYLRHFISPSPIYAQLPPEPGRHSMKYIIIICTFAPSLEKFQRMPIPSYPMKMWWHHQEPIGSRVPESEGHAPLFRKPLLALRLPPPQISPLFPQMLEIASTGFLFLGGSLQAVMNPQTIQWPCLPPTFICYSSTGALPVAFFIRPDILI